MNWTSIIVTAIICVTVLILCKISDRSGEE